MSCDGAVQRVECDVDQLRGSKRDRDGQAERVNSDEGRLEAESGRRDVDLFRYKEHAAPHQLICDQ